MGGLGGCEDAGMSGRANGLGTDGRVRGCMGGQGKMVWGSRTTASQPDQQHPRSNPYAATLGCQYTQPWTHFPLESVTFGLMTGR